MQRISGSALVGLISCLLLALISACSSMEKNKVDSVQRIRSAQSNLSMNALHPELIPLVKTPQHLSQLLGFEHISTANLMELRAKDDAKPYHPQTETAISEHWLKGNVGQPDVRVYVINAQPDKQRPAILYMHGGGFVLGKASGSVLGLQKLAKEHDCVVVSVDYRLAPETRFPGALEDNYTALLWLFQHTQQLGVDSNRLVLMGKSAGGGHAAMLAIAARDRGQVPIKQQILIYPMLDDRTGSTKSVPPWIGQLLWTEKSNQFGWSSLLGQPAGSKDVPIGSVPSRVEDLTGLPPTYIQVGSIDLFVQEDMDYAQRLILAGVSTELVVLPGMFHSAENVFRDTKMSKQFHRLTNEAIARAFAIE